MNNTSDYSIKVIDESAKELQESFFDVYFRQVGSLSYLLSQMEMLSENDKQKFSPLAQRQSERLNRAKMQFDSLLAIIKAIDADGKRIETLSFNIAQKMMNAQKTKRPVAPNKKAVAEVKTEPATEAATEAVAEVKTEPTTEAATEAVTEVKIEPATEVATEAVAEVKTEPATETATEAVAEVKTEPATEAATEAVAEVKTEPATEAATEAVADVKIEPATEVATEAVAEVKTEPATEVATEAVAEEPILIPTVNPEMAKAAEQATEPKELIEDTPEAANAAMFERFKSLPGMENLKINENGQPDFSSILPKDIRSKFKGGSLSDLTAFIAKYQREQMGVAPSTEPAVQLPMEGTSENSTVVVPTIAPPAAPLTSPSTEVVAEVSTEVVVEDSQVIVPAETGAANTTMEVANVSQENILTDTSAGATAVETTIDAVAADSQVIIPAVDSELSNQEVQSTEVVTDGAEMSDDTTLGENGLRRFVDNTTVPKAILVSELQFTKLGNSRVTQEALLKFKHVLPDIKSSSSDAVMPDLSSLSDVEKSKTIEAMMADANTLYNSGKYEEAQKMYDTISELNKSLVKE